ncbi:hypothetical protein EJ03DRAFT_204985 [Teratosphaeria nubilosa]|uniref:ML-like domain-containing protein n=1 Tax=Teratosphaeria nubilosa TaxID=161662 RepID=A0A6G1KYF8_9PEZI|nr:hypothetical protein EJ03DRAFT_204985 [Teratosphaeria nubilosa]
MNALRRRAWQALLLSLPTAIRGAFINFDNCLPDSITQSDPLQLQFTPLFLDAKFNRSADANYPLNVTIYGNVSGQQFAGTYPPPDSPQWQDGNETFGKIADVGTANKYTTLLSNFKVVTYDAWDAPGTEFCSTLVNGSCPLGPYFYANASNPYDLPAFSIQHDFGSPYSFTSLIGTIRILSGDTGATDIACISSSITPYLGDGIVNLITYLPAAVLILEAVKVLLAGIFSPWGSTDIFRFTSNYGRDPDLLRLVTPGFGDCLQYIQFATLSGALSLQYPGFYQPAVSQTAWSILEFNNSFVSHGNGTQSLVDGIYKYNGTYGMTAMSQLVGMSSIIDVWACMAVWLLVIAGIVVILCQLGFLGRWVYRTLTDTTEEDLRSKNLPFTMGNIIRLMFNYFILPIVSLSLFQLVISLDSPASVVACAVVLFVLVLLAGVWILRVIFTTKPRTILFDDMPIVLLYGPLYNTYSDSAAPFALVPVFITFMRGVAFGAMQPSGIAQVIVLAICEVILILTLNGFRPFQNQTSMNAYHTAFSIARLITVLLSIAFVETLGVNDSVKGWIGYAILIIHALVLVFGFFLNALQTIVEVMARAAGVGADPQTGAVRGSILTWRMLRKRPDRPNTGDRGSMTSDAAILQDHDARSNHARSRSMSASSQQLLNRATAPSINRMSGLENFSNGGDYVSSLDADIENAQSGFAYSNGQATSNKPVIAGNMDTADSFYRPPRQRRATNDLLTPGTKTRQSTVTSDFLYQEGLDDHKTHVRQTSDGGMYPDRDSPAPAYFRDRSNSNDNVTRPDYTTREVDLYYRGEQPRGLALSGQPTRKLKTGPADPEGPAASAQSWFQRLAAGFKGKQKEPSKGFEVVRSSRMPKDMMEPASAEDVEMQTSPSMNDEPYPR